MEVGGGWWRVGGGSVEVGAGRWGSVEVGRGRWRFFLTFFYSESKAQSPKKPVTAKKNTSLHQQPRVTRRRQHIVQKKRSRGVDIPEKANTDDSDEDYDPEDDHTEEEKKAIQNNRDLPHRRAKNKQHKEHISADVGSPHEDSLDDVEQAPAAGFGWKGNFYFLMYT